MALVVVLIGGATWLLAKLLEPALKCVGDRLGAWLFPAGQAVTFRVAYVIVKVVAALTPTRLSPTLSFPVPAPHHDVTLRIDFPFPKECPVRSGTFDDGEPWVVFPALPAMARVRYLDSEKGEGIAWPRLHRNLWDRPREAIAELDADLASGAPVTNPIRLVRPLVGEAIEIHRFNYRARRIVWRARWNIRHGSDDDCRLSIIDFKLAARDLEAAGS